MATVKPFQAIRPRVDLVEQVAALPYDVYNRAEARQAVQGKPYSFLNIDRPETQLDPEIDMYSDLVYQTANRVMQKHIESGIYVQDYCPAYYIYEQTMDGRVQTGLVGCSSIDDYQNEIIKKHENTRADKELDRIRHVHSLSAQTGPIFLAYRRRDEISAMIAKIKEYQDPTYDFVSEDGIGHRVWTISDAKLVRDLEEAFAGVDYTYIADGHHRAASAVKVGLGRRSKYPEYTGGEEFNYFLSVLFPDDELYIMDYNRTVKDLNGLKVDEFLTRIGDNFDVEKLGRDAYQPECKGTFGMYLDNCWYKLTAKEHTASDDAVKSLDVSVLQEYLLNPILGIEDPKTDQRIDFIGGIRGLKELERRADLDMRVSFSMYPTSISELFAVADAGALMPPKSTWFEPKLRSGLFIHRFER